MGLVLALGACSGAQEAPATAAAPRQFDPALAQLFDDDVDFVVTIDSDTVLEPGRWKTRRTCLEQNW